MQETPRECVERTRRAQGLPPRITARSFYDKLAAGIEALDEAEADERRAA